MIINKGPYFFWGAVRCEYLGVTDESGFYIKAFVILVDMTANIFIYGRAFRPGADKIHLPLQNIYQLGQFVKACVTQEFAEFSFKSVFVRMQFCPDDNFCIRHKSAELVHEILLFMQTKTNAAIKNRAVIIELYNQGDDRKKRDREDKKKQCKYEIKNIIKYVKSLCITSF